MSKHPALRLTVIFLCAYVPYSDAQDQDSALEAPFRWRPALLQSLAFLGMEHGFRILGEADTRQGLRGPFFHDYIKSLQGFHGWGDGDPFAVNYIGHPFQGAISGYIEVQNDPRYATAEFGHSSRYWQSRLRALAWSAAYSVQFELGPASEASLGNVGLKPGTFGAVDLIVTPAGGFGVMLAEDALDRFAVVPFERWSGNRIARLLVRGFLNPNRSLANMLRGELPWSRDSRPGVSVH